MSSLKTLVQKFKPETTHTVGDGFRVFNFFPGGMPWQTEVSPFILLDYHPPFEYAPSDVPRGVGAHPHKGFETVTLLFSGEVQHRDSAGNHGELSAGEVQWMTAGAGVLHEEKHGAAFSKQGGILHLIQLWVNLPAKFKNTPPSYQTLTEKEMPVIDLPSNSGTVKLVAGKYADYSGPAKTFTPVVLAEVKLRAGATVTFPLEEGYTALVLVISGQLMEGLDSGYMGRFSQTGKDLHLEAVTDAQVIILGGEPIQEPMVAYGPFVMNSRQEILQAYTDLQSGKFGVL